MKKTAIVLLILLPVVLLILGAAAPPPPLRYTFLSTNSTFGSPSDTQVPTWDDTNKRWTFGAGGSGGSAAGKLDGTNGAGFNIDVFGGFRSMNSSTVTNLIITNTSAKFFPNGAGSLRIGIQGGKGFFFDAASDTLQISDVSGNSTFHITGSSGDTEIKGTLSVTNGINSYGTGNSQLLLGSSNSLGGIAFSPAHNLPVIITNIFNGSNFTPGWQWSVSTSNNNVVTWTSGPPAVGISTAAENGQVATLSGVSYIPTNINSKVGYWTTASNVFILPYGDSLTLGSGSSFGGYPYYLTNRYLPSNFIIATNAGIGGRDTITMITEFTNRLGTYFNNGSNILVLIEGGVNDLLAAVTGENIYTNLVTLRNLCLAKFPNVRVAVMTVPWDRAYNPIHENDWYKVNALLRANASDWDYFYDLAIALPPPPSLLHTDLVHPNDTGYELFAFGVNEVLKRGRWNPFSTPSINLSRDIRAATANAAGANNSIFATAIDAPGIGFKQTTAGSSGHLGIYLGLLRLGFNSTTDDALVTDDKVRIADALTTFTTPINFTVATTNNWVGGTYYSDQTAYTNLNGVPTTFTNLGTVLIPANMLTNLGDSVVCRWEVDQQLAKANTNEFKIVSGASTIMDTGLNISSNGTITVMCMATRVSANLIRVSAREGGLDWSNSQGRPWANTNFLSKVYALDTGTNNPFTLQGSAQAVGAFTNRLTIGQYFAAPH